MHGFVKLSLVKNCIKIHQSVNVTAFILASLNGLNVKIHKIKDIDIQQCNNMFPKQIMNAGCGYKIVILIT